MTNEQIRNVIDADVEAFLSYVMFDNADGRILKDVIFLRNNVNIKWGKSDSPFWYDRYWARTEIEGWASSRILLNFVNYTTEEKM